MNRFRWPQGKVDREQMREMTDEAMVQLAVGLSVEARGAYAVTDSKSCRWLEFLDELPVPGEHVPDAIPLTFSSDCKYALRLWYAGSRKISFRS
jgi:hypothetical protein